MRIAQVAPLFESVPPQGYGGTERVVHSLTEELIQQGHEVTLFASGDSQTKARLCAPCARSLRTDAGCLDAVAYHVLMLEQVWQEARHFDLIHFHCDWVPFLLTRRLDVPSVHTLHGRLDAPGLGSLFQEFRDMPVVSISDAQRAPAPWLNWQATVYHGLPVQSYTFQARPGNYLVFLGRISPEKGVDTAIEIARRAGMPLKIAAKVDQRDQRYYDEVVKPLLRTPGVEFIGEVGPRDKDALLGGARALMFPIDWPEPFGLVMIEALACGTPVIGYRRGSVPEIIEHGKTGFIVDGVTEAVAALARVDALSRADCRSAYEQRFSPARMSDNYLAVYQGLVAGTRRYAAVL
jgi:glycosyltransferase involved in cell wall biosynthesis